MFNRINESFERKFKSITEDFTNKQLDISKSREPHQNKIDKMLKRTPKTESKSIKEASHGKNYRNSWSDDGSVYSQTYYISNDEYQKVLKAIEDYKDNDYGNDNIYGRYSSLKNRLTAKDGEIYPGLTAARFVRDILGLKNFKFDRNVRFVINDKKANIPLNESPVYDVSPQYDNRQSFYGKARVDDNGNEKTLYSYNTPVAKIVGNKVELLPKWDWSQTTLRHVKEFLKQNGFEANSLSQMKRDYL